jgi:hypothetical protein
MASISESTMYPVSLCCHKSKVLTAQISWTKRLITQSSSSNKPFIGEYPDAEMAPSSIPTRDGLPPWDQLLIDIKDYVFHYRITNSVAWNRSRDVLLDTIGCAVLAVKTSSECKTLLGPFIPDTQVRNGFRLPGTSFVLDPVKGAWDMGTMIRWLDFNDCIGGVDWGHPSGMSSNPCVLHWFLLA